MLPEKCSYIARRVWLYWLKSSVIFLDKPGAKSVIIVTLSSAEIINFQSLHRNKTLHSFHRHYFFEVVTLFKSLVTEMFESL